MEKHYLYMYTINDEDQIELIPKSEFSRKSMNLGRLEGIVRSLEKLNRLTFDQDEEFVIESTYGAQIEKFSQYC